MILPGQVNDFPVAAATAARGDRQTLRRNFILDRALPLFLQFGFEGVSMSMLARATEGSKGTLYAYFPTKADLFVALMERSWNRFEEPRLTNNPLTITDPYNWLLGWVEDYLTHLYDNMVITLHRLIIAEAARFPELGSRLYAAGPHRGLAQLSEDLSVLHKRRLILCEDADHGARMLRALAKSGSYERLLWGVDDDPSPQRIREDAAQAAAAFMSLIRQSPNR